ncbi:hypothetical protein ACOTCW_29305 [Achromobacter xylosoxidans]
MTDKAEFERLLDVYGFRCERFGQGLSTHARAQVVSAFAALASAPVADERDRNATISQIVGLCNRIPGSTTWNAAQFMYDEMHRRAALASAPVAGEAHRPLGHVAVLHSPCGARYFSRITSQHQAQVCAARWAKEYANVKPGPWPTEAVAVYAAPQASADQMQAALQKSFDMGKFYGSLPETDAEDVRNAALEAAVGVVAGEWKEGISLLTIAKAIRALKQPQADKDGGQQRASDGRSRDDH